MLRGFMLCHLSEFGSGNGIAARAAVLIALSAFAPAQESPPSRALSLELTQSPRLAGTIGSITGANIVAKHLEAAGWKVEFDDREVMLSMPRRIEIAGYFDAASDKPLFERSERFDPDAIPPGDVPAFNAWSASGTARGKVVDVGFGLAADYEQLAKAGVDVKGCIALARYGKAYRGVKAEMAEKHGCVGVLLFSDPSSDGGEKGPVWPAGPWKPDNEVQRGSILPVANAPGDPTTPNGPSSKHGDKCERVASAELTDALPKILCLPIPVREVRAIWTRMKTGPDGKPLGPGPIEIQLTLDIPREMRTIRNVIATLPGKDDQLVIAGAHRDAWVRGAQDSGSGCVVLMRVAQLLSDRMRSGWSATTTVGELVGERAKQPWQPQHTIQLAFWDAEEFGLIGSTEWGEANANKLREKCLVYVNEDASVSGTQVSASGTPGMLGLVHRLFERLKTADGSKTLWDDWSSHAKDKTPSLGLAGAGSDHTVFIHHLCIPVLEVGFGGNDGGGYHTTFDDFALVDRFLDPGWVGHELCATTLTDLLCELATAPGAGFSPDEAKQEFAKHARELATDPRIGEERANRLAAAFEALDFYRTRVAVSHGGSDLADAKTEAYHRNGWWRVFHLSDDFKDGLEGREWFKNRLWAPAIDNGYGSETFPTLRSAAARGPEALDAELTRVLGELSRGTQWSR
jgi:N-acetylated-alpha-linked acidic dipeptidase